MDEIYSREKAGNILESLVPHGKNPGHFMDGLAIKFKSVGFFASLYNQQVCIYLCNMFHEQSC